jgi:uncharacterized protein (DUF2147 family)
MKRLFLAALAVVLTVGFAQADPIYGIWETKADDNGKFGHIEIKDCDGKICGTLIKSFDEAGKAYDSENVGKMVIWDMKSKGKGKYRGGKIWAPDRDKVYKSKLLLSGDDLKASGCLFIVSPLTCRAQTWQRVK